VNASGTAFEAALVALLGRLRPGLVPDVLAADEERAWTLTRDAGPVLRTVADPEQLWSHWERLLPRYAESQLALAAHRDELVATGIPVLGPAGLAQEFRRFRRELGSRPPEDGGLTAEQASALDAVLPEYDAWCAELDASPIPDSVQHDDLHSANVCWNGSAADARIIDWGDASLGHPLGTMLATLNSIAYHAGLLDHPEQFDDPRLHRVRDAYLEPFSGLASRAELVRWSTLARRVGCVTRALSYEAAFRDADPSAEAEEDYPVRGWFLELLEPWARPG
jgi:hypothetical protein